MQPQAASHTMSEAASSSEAVWDLFVRAAHWTIVAGFFVAYFTEDDALTLHVWAGYAVGFVVLLRIVWGFVGPRHARFTEFLYRPSEVVSYCVICWPYAAGATWGTARPAAPWCWSCWSACSPPWAAV
jgi:hypothetical protein